MPGLKPEFAMISTDGCLSTAQTVRPTFYQNVLETWKDSTKQLL
jgi:hypothetical protein